MTFRQKIGHKFQIQLFRMLRFFTDCNYCKSLGRTVVGILDYEGHSAPEYIPPTFRGYKRCNHCVFGKFWRNYSDVIESK